MTENIVVTSPFVDQNNQLFYEATYNKGNQKLSLKIFNHRGVLKNKRTIALIQPIADLFTAQEYLIGLNHNHHQIFIFDVRQHLKTMTYGQLNSHTGMTQKMRENNQKFSFFFYNRQQPLIYGVFDQKYIFYFRLNFSANGDQSNLTNSRNTNESYSVCNNRCEIELFILPPQPISKLQVQYKQMLMQQQKSLKKRSVILQLSIQYKQERMERSRKLHNSNNKICPQIVTCIYLLIKHPRKMRKISVKWNSIRPQIDWIDYDDIQDFCYQNGWDLELKSNKKVGIEGIKRKEFEQVELTTKAKGQYLRMIKLSGNQKIFCCQQNLFIVDPDQQKINGIYNRQYFEINQCSTIPESIQMQNTLLMLQRPDFKHLKFIFYIFNRDLSLFTSFPLIVSLYTFQDLAKEELYLNKNIEKIFSPNGLIHPYFQKKVHEYLQAASENSDNNSTPSERSSQLKEIMKKQGEEKASKFFLQQNPNTQAKLFLEKFVLKDSKLLYRVIYQLCNYGVDVIFGQKKFDYSMLKETKSQNNFQKSSLVEHHKISSKIESNELAQLQNSQKNIYRCNFDTWNEYFQELLYKKVEALSKLFQIRNERSEIYNETTTNEVQTQIENIFDKINQNKQQLILLSNVYKRFAVLIESSESYQNNQSNKVLQSYHQVIKQKINTIHSLFLTYNFLNIGIFNHQRSQPQKVLRRLKQAINNLWKKFHDKRKRNINQFKNLNQQIFSQNQSKSKQYLSLSKLMPHEFFNSSRQLNLFQQKNQFEVFMNYLLSNSYKFQQTAYLYFLVRKELNEIIENKQRQMNDNKFMKINPSSVLSDVTEKSQIETSDQSLLFPYMSSDLIEFFENIRKFQRLSSYDKFTLLSINQRIIIVKKLQKLALQIGVDSFKFYMIQLCSQFKLPNLIIELVDTIKIQPFIDFKSHSYQQDQSNSKSKMKISRTFRQQQTFIIKSLINCVFNLNNYKDSVNQRQLLFYLIKRIILIENLMININNQQLEQLNSYQNYFHPEQINDNGNDNKEPKQVQIPSIQLKHYLLEYFVEAYLYYSQQQNIRQLEQLKRQCLICNEDKDFLESVIKKYLCDSDIKKKF